MIRKAGMADIEKVAEIYDEIHTEEEAGRMEIGWIRGIYPTSQTAKKACLDGELFVEDENGEIVAAAIINQKQVPEYADAAWKHSASDDRVMVLHTLVVKPGTSRRGYGKKFVAFYEAYAEEHGCPELRMDTNSRNRAARRLYHSLGYEEVGIVPCLFNGIEGVQLVCLEKWRKREGSDDLSI